MSYKKVFLDSDIILDMLLKREPFAIFSQILFNGTIPSLQLHTSTLIIANVHYFLKKETNKVIAKELIKQVVAELVVLPFDLTHITAAANSNHVDFEDSIQYYIAKQNDCDLIITRNIKHYKDFDIQVLTAEQFLRKIL